MEMPPLIKTRQTTAFLLPWRFNTVQSSVSSPNQSQINTINPLFCHQIKAKINTTNFNSTDHSASLRRTLDLRHSLFISYHGHGLTCTLATSSFCLQFDGSRKCCQWRVVRDPKILLSNRKCSDEQAPPRAPRALAG